MRSSFFEFNVAMSGLFTSRANLNIIGHNISNAGIHGYSRQVGFQGATRPMPLFNGKGMVGTGSDIFGIGQIRSVYLDRKYWTELGILGEYTTKSVHMNQMQNNMMMQFSHELDKTGINSAFDAFFATLQDLSGSANELTYRTNAIQTANSIVSMINTMATGFQKQQRDINAEVASMIVQVNSIGQKICSINQQIYKYELDGSNANDLRDERARLVDTLSQFININVDELDYGTPEKPNDKRYVIQINGYDFVNHFTVKPLEVRERVDDNTTSPPSFAYKNEMDVGNLYDIYFSNTNVKFDLYHPNLKGELKGLIDVRDGTGTGIDANGNKTSEFKGIPYYMEKLNQLVRTFAQAINEGAHGQTGHIYGYNLNEVRRGTLFFTYDTLDKTIPTETFIDFSAYPPLTPIPLPTPPATTYFDYSKINALNFIVNPELLQQPELLNCTMIYGHGESSNDLIMNLINVANDPNLFKEGKLSDFIISITGDLGIELQHAERFESYYSEMAVSIDNQRISISGVDLNEEMINMIRNQQIYQAAGRLINVIDDIYNFTINRLGNF